jgi:hypothetical protein
VFRVGNGVEEDALGIAAAKGIRPESARGRVSPLSPRELGSDGSCVGGDIDVLRGSDRPTIERLVCDREAAKRRRRSDAAGSGSAGVSVRRRAVS